MGEDLDYDDYEQDERWEHYSANNSYVMYRWHHFCHYYMDNHGGDPQWENRYDNEGDRLNHAEACIRSKKEYATQKLAHYLENYKYANMDEKSTDIKYYVQKNLLPIVRNEFLKKYHSLIQNLNFSSYVKIGMIMVVVDFSLSAEEYNKDIIYRFPNHDLFHGFSDKLKEMMINLIEKELKKDLVPNRIKALKRELELFTR